VAVRQGRGGGGGGRPTAQGKGEQGRHSDDNLVQPKFGDQSSVTRQVGGQTRKTIPQASVRSGSMKDMARHSRSCNISQAETKRKSLS